VLQGDALTEKELFTPRNNSGFIQRVLNPGNSQIINKIVILLLAVQVGILFL
jgi:hypothetical protein